MTQTATGARRAQPFGVRNPLGRFAGAGGGIVGAFSSLVAAQVIAALLGYLFWVAIARSMPASEIGIAHAGVSVMVLLGVLGTVGYGTLLLRELPAQAAVERRTMIGNALRLIIAVTAAIGIVWTLVAPRFGATFSAVARQPGSALLLILGIAATAVGSVLDQAAIGLGRPALPVLRNLVASSMKFPLMFALIVAGFRSHLGVLLAWVLPLVLSVALTWRRTGLAGPAAGRRAGRGFEVPASAGGMRQHLRRYLRPALMNHAVNLALAASSLFLPLMAAAVLTTQEYAGFSLAWLVATFVFTPAFMLAVALFATSVDDEAAYRANARRTLPAGAAIGLLCYLGAALLAEPIMATFGARYVGEGVKILRIVALAVLALVVKDHLFALYRVRRQLRRASVIGLLGLCLELAGGAVGAELAGAAGLAVGWLIALYLQAVLMLPEVLPGRSPTATRAGATRAGATRRQGWRR